MIQCRSDCCTRSTPIQELVVEANEPLFANTELHFFASGGVEVDYSVMEPLGPNDGLPEDTLWPQGYVAYFHSLGSALSFVRARASEFIDPIKAETERTAIWSRLMALKTA